APAERERHVADGGAARQRLHQDVADLRREPEDLRAIASARLAGEETGQQLGGRIQRHDAPFEIDGDDAVGQRVHDAVRVTLDVGQLLEPPLELEVDLLQRRALLEELGRHVIEGDGQTADLVEGRGLDALVQLAASDGGGSVLELADGDRKSTRLNSSHDQISYAVFCLKKKKN